MQTSGTHWEWTWMASAGETGLIIVALALAIAGILVLYRRERPRHPLPRAMRGVFTSLRIAVVVLVGTVLLGPARVMVDQRLVLPPIVVLRDASQSMSTRDKWDESSDLERLARTLDRASSDPLVIAGTRAEQADAWLSAEGGRRLRELARLGRLHLVDFAQEPRSREFEVPRDAEGTTVQLPKNPAEGRGTDLTAALRSTFAGESPAAILLITDGQHTGRDDPRDAAEEAQRRDIPLLIVGAGNPARPRNVRVAGVYARPRVWKDEPLEVEVDIELQNIPAGPLELTLLQRVADGSDGEQERLVVTEVVTAPAQGGLLRHSLRHIPGPPGKYEFIAQIAPVAGERELTDNRRVSLPVEVLDREQLRVLVVSGAASWDYQLVERLLTRDPTVQTSFWLQSRTVGPGTGGTKPIESLPADQAALNWYDVLLLIDPDPDALPPDWGELVRGFATPHAGGVFYMPGPRFGARWLVAPNVELLRAVLPVEWPDATAVETAALLGSPTRAWPLKTLPAERDHPLLRGTSDEPATGDGWERLPGVFWSFPIRGVRSTARVLLEHGDPGLRADSGNRPLLVVGRYGPARTAYLGLQGTWRWRQPDDSFSLGERFWSRLIRYLSEGRGWEGQRRGWLQTERDRYEVGDRILIQGRLHDAMQIPWSAPQVEAQVEVGGTTRSVVLQAVGDAPGVYEGAWQAREVGPHRFRVTLTDDASPEPLTVEANVVVEWPRIETAATWLDEDRLRELARISGGAHASLAEADALFASVPDRGELVETRRPAMPIWDRAELLLGVTLLLGVEWALRRRYKWE